MDLLPAISRLVAQFDKANVRYALIGGWAVSLRGVQRATFDLDFLLLLSDLDTAHAILRREGYDRVFQSPNVSHYENPGSVLDRVDILHAFRPPSVAMLERAERLPLSAELSIPVLQLEDIVGLKIQAAINNPKRALGDWNDIHRLIQHAAEEARPLHWDLIEQYLAIFRQTTKLPELRALYDEAR